MIEEWRSVVGAEGRYEVSNLGHVRSVDRVVRGRRFGSHLLNEHLLGGYRTVFISGLGGRFVHRLVAESFIPNPDNLPQVNHKDENVLNNVADNLEWCTAKYNANYGNHRAHISEAKKKPILKCDKSGNVIERFASLEDASKSCGNWCMGNIWKVATGYVGADGKRHLTAYGYKWKYED